MAVIEYDAYKQKLLALEPTLKELEQALNIEPPEKELAELQIETEQEGFWNDVERSQRIAQKIKRLENKIKEVRSPGYGLGGHSDPVRNGPGGGRRQPTGRGGLRL